MHLTTRMQWDIPFINNIDVNFMQYLAQLISPNVIGFIELIYQFKPVKFSPFVIILCWLWYKTDNEEIRKKIIDTVIYGFISLVFCRILSFTAPFRPRPSSNPILKDMVATAPTDGWSSFPSDHGVFSFAMAYGLFRIKPIYGYMFGLYSFIVVCFPRAILHIHYPSDLVAGAFIGLCFSWGLSKLKYTSDFSNLLYHLSISKPVIFYSFSTLILFEFIEMFETPRRIIFSLHDILKTII